MPRNFKALLTLPVLCMLCCVDAVLAQSTQGLAPAVIKVVKASPADQPAVSKPPERSYALDLQQLAKSSDFKLYGINNLQNLEFTLSRNQLVTRASLELVFTPSYALLPKVSHLRVYLNDELMQVVPILVDPPGKQQTQSIPLDPAYLSTYNRIRIEFVGHYTEVCEDLSNSALWLDLSRKTQVVIQEQALLVANELSFFPEPFLDINDMLGQVVPFVFPTKPSIQQVETATTLASYLGAVARWREVQFPVSFGELPIKNHSIVFATNDQRPDFLKNHPPVDQATVDIINAPNDPFQKILLILGRDDNDLKTAVNALTLGGALFRGQSAQVNAIDQLTPRKPYDAPYWISTDRPVYFSELVDFPGQLEVSGLRPRPIRIYVNVPPDLFVWRSKGIPIDLIYRYTSPIRSDESRLTLSLNDRFVSSYSLRPIADNSTLTHMRLQVLGTPAISDTTSLIAPAFRLGAKNQIGLDFSFASTAASTQTGSCQTILPVDMRASVDANSSVNFSGYAHYVDLPNLRIFANSGFPFSRMADLSETVVVLAQELEPIHVSTLLKFIGNIGAQTGYPAYRLRIVQDWESAKSVNADLLWIGPTPADFRDRPDANLLLDFTTATLARPLRPERGGSDVSSARYIPETNVEGALKVSVRSVAPIAAIVGMQSPYFSGRSMVGLLASTPTDFKILNDAIGDAGKRSAMEGSVVIIRASGVDSHLVGPRYFVGNLAWWQRLWFELSERPLFLAATALIGVLLTAWLAWMGLSWIARRRLSTDA